MFKLLFQTVLARWFRCAEVDSAQHRKLVDRVCMNEPEYAQLLAHLQRLNWSEDELRKRSALEAFVDSRTGKVWEMVIVDDGPAPLYGLECYGEIWPSAHMQPLQPQPRNFQPENRN